MSVWRQNHGPYLELSHASLDKTSQGCVGRLSCTMPCHKQTNGIVWIQKHVCSIAACIFKYSNKTGCTVMVSRLPNTSPALSGGCCSAKWYPSCVAKRADPKSATCRDQGITLVTVSGDSPSDHSAGHAPYACAFPNCCPAVRCIPAMGNWLYMHFCALKLLVYSSSSGIVTLLVTVNQD